MTVKELIERLQKEDPNRIVVLSIDPEGNGYNELRDIATSAYSDGEIGIEELTPELQKEGYREEDVMEDGHKAVVLWP
jgi:hypothetical protein